MGGLLATPGLAFLTSHTPLATSPFGHFRDDPQALLPTKCPSPLCCAEPSMAHRKPSGSWEMTGLVRLHSGSLPLWGSDQGRLLLGQLAYQHSAPLLCPHLIPSFLVVFFFSLILFICLFTYIYQYGHIAIYFILGVKI